MGTIDGVSLFAKDQMAAICNLDGDKKKIDSDREYLKAKELLAQALSYKGNNAELAYIKGFMLEYETKVNVSENNIENFTAEEGKTIAERITRAINEYKNDDWNYGKLTAVKYNVDMINKDNVANVLEYIPDLAKQMDDIDYLGMGYDKNDVIKKVLNPLLERAGELKIETALTTEEAKKMSLEDLQKVMNDLAKKIRDKDKSYITTEAAAQEVFDNANKILSDAAGMDENKLHFSDNYYFTTVQLPDGRVIDVEYENGEISGISIYSYDPYVLSPFLEPDRFTNTDKYEVHYAKNEAYFETDYYKKVRWGGTISTGYDFEKIKEYVELILAKAPKEQ